MADSSGWAADIKGAMPLGRLKYLGVPDEKDTDSAKDAAGRLTDIGGMVQPASLAPSGTPAGSYAASPYPDYVRMKQLANESAQQAGMAAMKPIVTRGNLNPQPVGDNALSAYVRQKNDAEQKMIMDKASRDQGTADLYNKLLLTRTDQIGGLAQISASHDKEMADKASADKKDALQATLDAKQQIAEEHNDTLKTITQIRAAEAHSRATNPKPPSTKEIMGAKTSYSQAADLYDSLEDVKKTITDNDATHAHDYVSQHAPKMASDVADNVAEKMDNFESTPEYQKLMTKIAIGAKTSGDRATNAMFNDVSKKFPHNGESNYRKKASIESYQQMAQEIMRNGRDTYGDTLFSTPEHSAPVSAPHGKPGSSPAPSAPAKAPIGTADGL